MQRNIYIGGVLLSVVMVGSMYAAEPAQARPAIQPDQLAKEALIKKGPAQAYQPESKSDRDTIVIVHGAAKNSEVSRHFKRAEDHQSQLEQPKNNVQRSDESVQSMLNDYEWTLGVLQSWVTTCRNKGPKTIINDSFADCRKRIEHKKQ